MKKGLHNKSILLFMVLVVGTFFILGSGAKVGQKPVQKKLTIEQSEVDNLNPSDRSEFDALSQQEKILRKKHKKLETLRWSMDNESSKLDEEITIAVNRNNRKLETINNKKKKLIDESKKTCFPENTKVVMHDGSLKSIDTITQGDKVMIYDIAEDSIGISSVNEKFIDKNNHMYILNNSIQATSYERFLTQDGWKRMGNLSITDSVFNGNSFIGIDSISKVKKDLTVYNLNINATHNFFVSYGNDNEWFLIHNSSDHGGGGGRGDKK